METNTALRWEWRVFVPSVAEYVPSLTMPLNIVPRESDELYILNLSSPGLENVKIRNGVLDIKRIRNVNPDGLEKWEPVFKVAFPVKKDDIIKGLGPWGPRAAVLARDRYTVEQLIEEFVAPDPALRAVCVHKSRRRFVFAECLAETVELLIDDVTTQSLSLEHEDPALVLAALRTLGLDAHANTNYPRGIMHVLGIGRGK